MAVTFSDPVYLWFILIIPLFILTHFYAIRFVKKRAVRLANFEALKRVSGRRKIHLNMLMLMVHMLVLTCLVFSAAGVVFWYTGQSSNNNFVLAIDASGSMLATDFEPNRLEAAKEAAIRFVNTIDSRASIAVVSFSGASEVNVPLTSNFVAVKAAIEEVDFKTIHGTALGEALKTALNLFVKSDKPNIIILLTDGQENVIPKADLRRITTTIANNQIVVHTIGVGTTTGAAVPGINLTSILDESTLQEIASGTGGKYFRAADTRNLEGAYAEIATSSESEIPINMRIPLIIIALLLLFIEWGFMNTKYKTIP